MIPELQKRINKNKRLIANLNSSIDSEITKTFLKEEIKKLEKILKECEP